MGSTPVKVLDKNLELLAYIINSRPNSGVTELMKLCYLIDLTSLKKFGKKISEFKYIRYSYGPFDEKIYPSLKSLVAKGIISEDTSYTPTGNEYITYRLCENAPRNIEENLNSDEKELIDEVLEVMKGHGAKALTDVAYKTKPMRKLGATLGGNENLNVELDLKAE